jgi:hypothetical protein
MTTTERPVVRLDDVYGAMREAFRAALTAGRNWHAVTVGCDGTPYVREEVSRCASEAEYYRQDRPHPVTVWSMAGDSSVGVDEVDAEVDAFDPADQFGGNGGVGELVRKMEEAGFTVED